MCMDSSNKKIDTCMKKIVALINDATNYKTLGCCCGHGFYPMTVVVDDQRGRIFEYFSEVDIPRKKRFYVKDKGGFYFIPEVVENA